MYIEQDFVGPATLDLQANRKMHNKLLRYWPTKWVNGVEVMDRLYLYAGGSVQESTNHKKIYNILGISVEDLKKEKWKGVENYYIYFNVVQGTYDDLTNEQLDTYIDFQAPFTVKSVPEAPTNDRSDWFISELSYEPLKVDTLSNALSDSQIIANILANPYGIEYSIEDEHVLTALALLDTNEVIFERSFRVTYRGLTDVTFTSQTSKNNAASFVKEVNIEFKFRRKPAITQLAYDTYLASAITAIYNSQYNRNNNSVQIQLLDVYHGIVPFVDSDILLIDPEFSLSKGFNLGYYKKDGLQAMKSKEFNKTITARIKTGYTKKKVSKWKKFVTVVVVVIIVVVAVLAAIPTGGGSIAWGQAALVLTIGSLAMMGISIILAKRDPAWAAYIGKASQVLGIAATIVGITVMIQNLARTAAAGATATKEAATQSLIAAGKEVTAESIKAEALAVAGRMSFGEALKEITFESMGDMLINFVKDAFSATSINMQSMLNAATKGFQLYVKYINPPADGLDEMTRQVQEQEQQLEDLSSAELKDKIDYTFSSPFYNIYDLNEIMQAVPYTMTQGMIDNTFNKYYDGVTSTVKYRGYLG